MKGELCVLKKIVILLLAFHTVYGFSRDKRWADLGAHVSYISYNGDMNESKLFYSPSVSQGIFLKQNFSDRYAIRFGLSQGKLKASDSDFQNVFQQQRGKSFSARVWDLGLINEFNFFEYSPYEFKGDFISPYIMAGLGVSISFTNLQGPQLNIPFGLGLKVKINERIGIGAEWSFRKIFNDELDGIKNYSNLEKKSLLHNNDWYTFAGIFLSYVISDLKIDCPTYD
ncbi:DUF6089 family protein [Bacteroidota bacterium]